jgi:choline dehydrogenase-like flavoprotein
MNPQSRGTVSLQTRDPRAYPIIDPAFLSHPFDRRLAIEATRELLCYLKAPVFKNSTIRNVGWPRDTSDDGLLVGSSPGMKVRDTEWQTGTFQAYRPKLLAHVRHHKDGPPKL